MCSMCSNGRERAKCILAEINFSSPYMNYFVTFLTHVHIATVPCYISYRICKKLPCVKSFHLAYRKMEVMYMYIYTSQRLTAYSKLN